MIKYYKYAHWLSLDVVLGAVLCHRMAARLSDDNTQINWFVSIILALVVFCIYLIDRVLDNHKAIQDTDRHRFQNQYKSLLIKIILGLVAIGFVLLFWLPKTILLFGLGLGVVAGLYLLAVYQTKPDGWFVVYKDLFVPIIYSLGVWATALLLQPEIHWEGVALGVTFWLIVQQSLLLNAYFESFTIEEGNSLAIVWGEDTTRKILKTICVFATLICIVSGFVTENRFALRVSFVMIVMVLVNQWLVVNRQKWLANERYRLVAEAVFFVPFFIL
jgi:4-hydroxybenzoate polyprenyltransferase